MNVVKPQEEIVIKDDSVEAYILSTLLYTPHNCIANRSKYTEIKAYAPNKDEPAMKIFRMIFHCSSFPEYPSDIKEIAFVDQISLLNEEGGINKKEFWKLEFSIDVDKQNYLYKAIRQRPKEVSHLMQSIEIITSLSKQKGAMLLAGDWVFESDGNGWIPCDKTQSLKSVIPELPNIQY